MPKQKQTHLTSPNAANGANYQSFIENLPVMFYAVAPDPPHAPLYISPTFIKFGYPIEEWMTQPDIWDRIIHPEDRQEILDKTRAAMRTGQSIDFEYRIVCADGRVIWVRDRSCFIYDDAGNKTCWQGVILDIDDRKRAQQKLERSERLYRQLANHIPQTAVLIFDRDLNFKIAEGEQLQRGIYSRETFADKSLYSAFPPEVVAEWEPYYRDALSGKEIAFEHVSEDGIFKINVRPVRDEKDEIFAGMVMWQDISDTRRADEALRESEERYRQLFENANDIIYLHDLQGNYISINEAGSRVFGYTRDEAIKLNMSQVAAPGQLELMSEKLAKKIAGDTSQTVYEVECIRKDGSTITLEVNSNVISKDGKPIAVQGVARDITERKIAEEQIRKSENKYRDLFENANDLIYTHDLKGNITSLNRAGELITGYSRDEASRVKITEVIAPEYLESANAMAIRRIAGEAPTPFDVEIVAKQGHRVKLELSTRLMTKDGKPIGIQGLGRDITARSQAEASLRETLSLFETTFESTADGIVVMSLDKQIVTCNKKFVEMWQVPKEIIDRKDGPALVRHVAGNLVNSDEFLKRIGDTYRSPEEAMSEILELRDGRIFERYSQPQFLEGRAIGRVASFRDITERSRAEERLRHYALHDNLTDLPNRVQFMQRLDEAVKRSYGRKLAKFAVLFLDLDRFKIINDSLGHAIGDKLLIEVAAKLKSCIRPGDVVARLGGDEFTILLDRSGEVSEVVKVAERLQSKISEPVKIDNYEVFTTASIGVVVAGGVERTAEDFLRDADAAMYRAKDAGKARYEVFDREMHVRNMNLLQVETDLRHAVERQEFEVMYQPIVNLMTGDVNEFEALIRWRHPIHGLVGPNEFVHVAEETGLIIPMGHWILEECCRQIARWQTKFGSKFSVSVNLSAKQLMHPALTQQVSEALEHNGLVPTQLKLEVTESTVMEHSDRALKILSELDALGVALSTDDFGTGYSSLSYLQKFPFERLKIDRSFINKMDDDEKSSLIVKTILMLGENLDLEVVAEGIETAAQLRKLRELGCRLGQGYLFARPLEAKLAEDFLQSGAGSVFDTTTPPIIASTPRVIEVSNLQ